MIQSPRRRSWGKHLSSWQAFESAHPKSTLQWKVVVDSLELGLKYDWKGASTSMVSWTLNNYDLSYSSVIIALDVLFLAALLLVASPYASSPCVDIRVEVMASGRLITILPYLPKGQ